MTLFRKVFQNQSRPATGDEALDEDALRDAFMVTSEDRVLPLDPFAVATDGEEVEETRQERQEEEDEASAENLPDEEVVEAEAEAETEAEEDEEPEGADIAAVLAQTRMMEKQPVRVEPSEGPEEHLTEAFEDEDATAPEGAPEMSDDMEEVVVPADNDTSDVVAFAKRQLELSGGATEADNTPEPEPVDLSENGQMSAGATPMAGRAGRRAGRVKTRLLGFNRAEADANDPIGAPESATAKPQHDKFPVGWLVVVEGPGIGHSFSIFTGASMIGRGDDQVIKLDFGDNSISRHNHAAIAYDEEQNKFYLGHGGKSNIIRRNARPVLSTEELQHADLIRIGETTLRFVALCGSDFKWEMTDGGNASDL
ncbi:FHA domain-containing protein [uncultured Roseobacter sp.]|uniref:FHA domain-containing protein n=1 Tax=uncultured Roseobacter sp. TaxID=114847 RepID=UPI0026182168|nr:FHA domain-containing protein [uncultured Roseobacter sp.]